MRGLPVDDAIRVLQLCEKDAADNVLKLLDSAVANAEHNQQLPADELYLARIWCDEGPTRKSGQARARGRYFRVRKRTSHVTIILARYDADELESPAPPRGVERPRRGDRAAPARRSACAGRASAEQADTDTITITITTITSTTDARATTEEPAVDESKRRPKSRQSKTPPLRDDRRRRSRRGVSRWVKKSIRTGSASVSPPTGSRAGSPTRSSTPSSSSKTGRSATTCASSSSARP